MEWFFRTSGPIAQQAEQGTLNPKIEGSIPSGPSSFLVKIWPDKTKYGSLEVSPNFVFTFVNLPFRSGSQWQVGLYEDPLIESIEMVFNRWLYEREFEGPSFNG